MADTGEPVQNLDERDAHQLEDFGYKQELRRDWGLLHNFGISFSIIVSTNCNCLYPFPLTDYGT